MNFTKVQGTGNDFVLIEAAGMERDWAQTAIAMCDRHFGVGADGLLLLLPSAVADFRMRIFNSDGSEAETCGNGLRCLVNYILETGLSQAADSELSIETLAGVNKATFHRTPSGKNMIRVSMGIPRLGAADIPVILGQGSCGVVDQKPILDYPVTVGSRELLLNLVSMGNPHAVCFIPQGVVDFPLTEVAVGVDGLDIFPVGVNVEVAQLVSVRPPQIRVRVWERGVGETLACGSGACAVTVAARLHGHVADNKIDIMLPGGTLQVEWDGAGEAFLIGPAEIVFKGEWLDENI